MFNILLYIRIVPAGMEFLVPKTGFFCKLCNRFFTGGQESELNHCKSQNHHVNWQVQLDACAKDVCVYRCILLKSPIEIMLIGYNIYSNAMATYIGNLHFASWKGGHILQF